MKKLFRREIAGVVVATAAAGISYRAGVDYLPSVLIMVTGFLVMGIFAETEDELLRKLDGAGIDSHDRRLVFLHLIRSIVLLSIGVLVFVVLARQF